jgi:hypothetical protein
VTMQCDVNPSTIIGETWPLVHRRFE